MERTILVGERSLVVSSDDNYLQNMGDSFEPHMTALFTALIKPDMLVADVGANIGMTSLLFSQLALEVHAFEPSRSTFSLLKKNIQLNKITNVASFNIGMGEKSSRQTITFSSNNRSGGFISDKEKPTYGHITEDIEISTLDSFYWNRTRRPNFIKVDVEGFEPRVIAGSMSLIAVERPTMVLELNHFCLQILQRVTLPEYFDLLRSIFPVLVAVQSDNSALADLHDKNAAYSVMHEHVVRFHFPNIVAGFDPEIRTILQSLQANS